MFLRTLLVFAALTTMACVGFADDGPTPDQPSLVTDDGLSQDLGYSYYRYGSSGSGGHRHINPHYYSHSTGSSYHWNGWNYGGGYRPYYPSYSYYPSYGYSYPSGYRYPVGYTPNVTQYVPSYQYTPAPTAVYNTQYNFNNNYLGYNPYYDSYSAYGYRYHWWQYTDGSTRFRYWDSNGLNLTTITGSDGVTLRVGSKQGSSAADTPTTVADDGLKQSVGKKLPASTPVTPPPAPQTLTVSGSDGVSAAYGRRQK